MGNKALVIGGGFGGLSTASLLARDGWSVSVLEKNDQIGGRARYWEQDGYTFDMGPSWYLMPEVFERYFSLFGKKRASYYDLKMIDPYYKVFFEGSDPVELTPRFEENQKLFESFEPGGGEALKAYMKQSTYKYEVAMEDFLYRDYKHIAQFFNRRLMTEGLRLGVLNKLDGFVSEYVKDQRAKQILEYAMVFLGTDPAQAPAIYSIMTHVDLNLGVFFPKKGMAGSAQGFANLCRELGVEILPSTEVTKIVTKNGKAIGVETNRGFIEADVIVSSADYHHSEQALLDKPDRTYNTSYWEKRVVAPSMFIAYLGVGRKLQNLEHHNLYFAKDWNKHFDDIFKKPKWPDDPCFYLSCITKTDSSSAPEGCENIFLLVPVAPDLEDSDEIRESYFNHVCDHVKRVTKEDLREDLQVKRLYSHRDFIQDYNAYKGTALGLSHTLLQTAVFRPRHQSKRVKNLYFTGQYTHPGVGVPMVLIASELIAKEIKDTYGR